MVQIRRKGPKRSEHVGIQKGANFTIVSTMVLIGLNIKFFSVWDLKGGQNSGLIVRKTVTVPLEGKGSKKVI